MKAAKDASLVRTQTAILMPWHGHEDSDVQME